MNESLNQNLGGLERRAFELCLAVYRLTNIFPPEEILKKKLRDLSADIASLLAVGQIRDTILNVEKIKICLEIAKAQNWVSPINFDLLKSAYCLLEKSTRLDLDEKNGAPGQSKREKSALEKTGQAKNRKESFSQSVLEKIEQRRNLIIAYFEKNKEAAIADLIQEIKGVNVRTIRNDLFELENRNLIKKSGSNKFTKYLLISDPNLRLSADKQEFHPH